MTERTIDGVPGQARERLHRALRLSRPLPRVGLDLGPSLSGWALRGTQVVVAVIAGLLVLDGSFEWAAALVALVLLVARPSPMLSVVVAFGLGIALLLQPLDPSSPRPYLILFLSHLIVVLGTVIGRLRASARYEWRALATRGTTFVVVQAVSQAVAVAMAAVALDRPALAEVAVAAGLVLVVLIWVVVATANAATLAADRRRG